MEPQKTPWNFKKTPWPWAFTFPFCQEVCNHVPYKSTSGAWTSRGGSFRGMASISWKNCWQKCCKQNPQQRQHMTTSLSPSSSSTTTVSHTLQNGRQTSHMALSHANARNANASFPSMTATAARKRILRRLAFDKSHDGFISGYPVLNHAYLPLSCTEHGAYASHATSTPHAKHDNQTTQTRITLLLQDTKDCSIEF